jgi:hypothetical protein
VLNPQECSFGFILQITVKTSIGSGRKFSCYNVVEKLTFKFSICTYSVLVTVTDALVSIRVAPCLADCPAVEMRLESKN